MLKKYKEEDLRLLIVEMYKSIPKNLRENKEIDDLLKDAHGHLSDRSNGKKLDNHKDIKELNNEISLFIDYAYKQYYFAPNNYVYKKDRPKWRFKVKDYIKSLQCVPNEGEEGRIIYGDI